jgi:hypothetical protein
VGTLDTQPLRLKSFELSLLFSLHSGDHRSRESSAERAAFALHVLCLLEDRETAGKTHTLIPKRIGWYTLSGSNKEEQQSAGIDTTERERKERHTPINNLLLVWWIIVVAVDDDNLLHWWQLLSPEETGPLRQW